MTIWARGQFGSAMVALTLALMTEPVMAQAQQKVLRVVPQGEVKVFDRHQSQVNLTSMHAALVYDTLFSWDADMVAPPQMVERWTVSDDRLLYTFTLRSGLKFNDGSPVTTRDVIATLKRFFLRDSQIQSLAQRVATLESIDDGTFTIGLKEPFRFVEFLLGGSNGIADAIMREKEAITDPYTRSPRSSDRGHSASSRSEYLPGAKLVYEKNPFYVARSEPASGFSGRKLVKVDRVEFIIIPDATVAIAALRNGEVDFIDAPSLDVVPTVANDPNIVVREVWPIETCAVLRPNSIQPPFNNVEARPALAYMSDQREYMTAAYGDPKYWRKCYAYWVCGSPNGIEVGSEDFRHPNLEKARQLIIESGYKGEKVVLIGGADVPAYNTLTAHHSHPMAALWGDGTTSSSDDQYFRAGGVRVMLSDAQVGVMRVLVQPIEDIGRLAPCRREHLRIERPVLA